jgi:hypothetical protein
MRVLVLAIASGDVPEYAAMKAALERHADAAPPGVDVRFLYGSSGGGAGGGGARDWAFDDVPETFIPGILHKTLRGFERALAEGYDVVVRTNLSSFFHWRALLDFVRAQPSTGLAAGLCPDRSHLSGCNLVLSRDVVEAVLAAREALDAAKIDDLALSEFLLRAYAPTWVPRLEIVFSGSQGHVLLHPGDAAVETVHVRLKNPGARGADATYLRALVDAYDADATAEALCLGLGR